MLERKREAIGCCNQEGPKVRTSNWISVCHYGLPLNVLTVGTNNVAAVGIFTIFVAIMCNRLSTTSARSSRAHRALVSVAGIAGDG